MNRALTLLIGGLFAFGANAQTGSTHVKYDEPYGVIDTADLTMKECDFEKDANAEVLIDKGDEVFDITFVIHKRIKIFNENGKNEANIKIPFVDRITDIKAETINLTGKTITYTPVDVNQIFKQKVDADEKALTFTFPDGRKNLPCYLCLQLRLWPKPFILKTINNYADFHEFYKKMYEALNEQIVLKKT